jgi:two-component system, OmpR family, sensor histidine kinase KdpD
MPEERADTFLRMIRRSQRGRLKIYLGYCAGVGKTFQMLLDGQRLKKEGIDVVIGLVEPHGRPETAQLIDGLEVIPRYRLEYHGIVVEEMDVDAVIKRKPEVALIDELAHTNVPGSRNSKRYEDVQDILAAGIHVMTTLNLQHLESLYDTVERAVGIKVRERLPDTILAEADQIVNIDLTTEDLRKRLQEGKVYTPERIDTAMTNFFQASNLEQLRELTLRELAAQIDLRRREHPEDEIPGTPDQIMVCLSSRGPNREMLLRYASRLAGRLNRNWYAIYVQTPSEEATVVDVRTQHLISNTLTMAKQLGAMVFTYKGEDVADTILGFAKEYGVGHIVTGKPTPKPLWKRFGKNKDIVGDLIAKGKGLTVIVIDTGQQESHAAVPQEFRSESTAPTGTIHVGGPETRYPYTLSQLLTPRRILIWEYPITKEAALRALVMAIAAHQGAGDPVTLFREVMKREQQGSTFFNEGAAFPHVRVSGLTSPVMALGITKKGIEDASTEQQMEVIFLILSPEEAPDTQVQILGLASRAGRNRHLLQALRSAPTPEVAATLIRTWEADNR